MTGVIVGLVSATRTGAIRSQDGSRLVFSASSVLGDFDSLAVGHKVNYDLDRFSSHSVAVRVFREPPVGGGRAPAGAPDFRYAGFSQSANVRTYAFETWQQGGPVGRFAVSVDLALLAKHRIGVQEIPALCLRKLKDDLKDPHSVLRSQLGEGDLVEFASARDAAQTRKKPKHSFAGRRGAPPPSPPDWRAP